MKLPIFLLLLITIFSSCSKESKIDKIFADYSGKNPGASAMVIKDGKLIINQSFGMANVDEDIAITPTTNFRLASVTKQFTSMSIMLLVQDKKINLNDKLTDIFPDFPKYGETIKIRHLLQHTSGLIDYEDLILDSTTEQVHDYDILEMMKSVDSTYFESGTQHRYSNSAYAVLVMIIEQLSAQSFPEFLYSRIFLPLGMTNSIAFIDGKNKVENRAFGYHLENDSIKFSDQSITSAVLGDGGIYSSVVDLYKWDQALYTEELLSNELFNEYVRPGIGGYGFGWRIDKFQEHYRMSHTGSTCGFRNVIQRYPEDKLTVIILTNRREPGIENLADDIAKMYLY